FGNKHESNLRSALQMVEEAMGALGPDFRFETLGKDTSLTWRVHRGPLEIRATLRTLDDGNYLRVVAYLAEVPAGAGPAPVPRPLPPDGRRGPGGRLPGSRRPPAPLPAPTHGDP